MTDPSPTLQVAVLPLDIALASPVRNMEAVLAGISVIPPGTDLIVLPELFSTGFITDIDEIRTVTAQSHDVLSFLRTSASESRIALAGSFLAWDNDAPVNRGFIILPDRREVFYDKRHLFCLSPEHTLLRPGTQLPSTVSYKGWNLSVIICYDLRFPVWCRNVGNRYDIMIVSANWPNVRQYAWEHLLIARAIENQAFYIGANRAGCDRFGDYTDSSMIVNERGQIIGDSENGILSATLSKSQLYGYREKLPVWRDADRFRLDL